MFAPTAAAAYFAANMRVAADRLGLEWPTRVDLLTDGLRFRAFPGKAEAEFGALSPQADYAPASVNYASQGSRARTATACGIMG